MPAAWWAPALQLVMYPILDLTRHKQDLHWYLRGLEEVVVRALADTSGLQGQRIEVSWCLTP
jgi:lipoyl(octanoyl) transferase